MVIKEEEESKKQEPKINYIAQKLFNFITDLIQ